MVIINRAGHVIYSELILILVMGGYLLLLLQDSNLIPISVALITGIGAYLLGAIMPDFDHQKVHKIKWFAKISKHRGHFHSLGAMLIYGGIVFLVFGFIMDLWYVPVGAGMFGFFTHLLLDEIKNIKTNGSRAIKLW